MKKCKAKKQLTNPYNNRKETILKKMQPLHFFFWIISYFCWHFRVCTHNLLLFFCRFEKNKKNKRANSTEGLERKMSIEMLVSVFLFLIVHYKIKRCLGTTIKLCSVQMNTKDNYNTIQYMYCRYLFLFIYGIHLFSFYLTQRFYTQSELFEKCFSIDGLLLPSFFSGYRYCIELWVLSIERKIGIHSRMDFSHSCW